MSNINVVKYIEKKDFFCFCTQSSKLQKNISFTCGKTIKNNGAGYPAPYIVLLSVFFFCDYPHSSSTPSLRTGPFTAYLYA
jgi:hypothetical protein